MFNAKQEDRLTLKAARLPTVYAEFLEKRRIALDCILHLDGDKTPAFEGMRWGGEFVCGEFIASAPVLPFGRAYLFCDTGGVESLIKINGEPIGVADWLANGKDAVFRLHKYTLLENLRPGDEIAVESYASHTFYGTMPYEKIQTFGVNGYEPERVFNGIYIVELDEDILRFTRNMYMVSSYFKAFNDGDSYKTDCYRLYERIFALLPAAPGERPSKAELESANILAETYLASIKPFKERPYIGIVGHSHLDTAWLWPIAETERKAVRTVANAVTLLERHKDYKFIFSSALHLMWIKDKYPSLFGKVAALVREGRLEPNGGSYIECDCNLTGGESLLRQFLVGQRFLKEEFDYQADTFWLPDTFGYSAALPQLLRAVGIKYFLTTKLSWNDTNKFPFDSFVWRGIDGSRVLVHFNTTQSYADPEFVASRAAKLGDKHYNDCALIAYGFGDGGAGPDENMVDYALRTEDSFPYAKVCHTTVSDFMRVLENRRLPEYYGELYLELHRGTLTSIHEIKRNNRKLEIALHDAELLSVFTDARRLKKRIDSLYLVLLKNQFHDILPGTCIAAVNDESLKETSAALAECGKLIAGDGEKLYFNTLSFVRTEMIADISGAPDQIYTDIDGKQRALSLYAFSAYGYGEKVACGGECPFRISGDKITTPFHTAVIKNGRIESLIYGGREIAAAALGDLRIGEDVPYLWDNWDIDADAVLKENVAECISTDVVSMGSLALVVRFKYRLTENSTLFTDMVFSAVNPTIVFENRLFWHDHHKLLRVYFPTTVNAPSYRSEIQFGHTERVTDTNTPEAAAQFEACNHKWSDISETNFGVAFLNDCKYGCNCKNGVFSLTLFKSGRRPDQRGDEGEKHFSYALLPHKGGFSAETVVKPAYAFNYPPVLTALCPQQGLITVSATNIICETVKFAEEKGIVLRLYECERSAVQTVVELNREYSVYECDALENIKLSLGKTKQLTLDFRAFEIKTLLLK